MTVAYILITNILPTGTAFGVRADNHAENVFLPARITGSVKEKLLIGQTVRALVIPNQSHRERTPWVAIRIEAVDAQPRRSTLAEQILIELTHGNATGEEICAAVGQSAAIVTPELQSLIAQECVTSCVVFDLPRRARATATRHNQMPCGMLGL